MKNFKSLKLINNKKTLIIVAFLMFFTLFLNGFISVAFAQYEGDAGSYYYPSVSDAGSYSYPSIGDAGTYNYPSVSDAGNYYYPSIGDAGSYSYPSIGDAGTYNYPSVSDAGSYYYPPISYPGTYTYPVASYGNYSYPLPPTPSVNNYPAASYGNYSYPLPPTPSVNNYPAASYGNYTYPSISYSGGYDYWPFGGYPSTTAYAATIDEPANIPTGPEGTLPWILLGGLALSAVVYLILFRIRFRGRITLAGAYRNAMLERRIRKIRSRELKPDISYDFQS